MSTSPLEQEFRRLFGALAERISALRFEWRDKSSLMSGPRLDLVCAVGTPAEVFASIFESSVAVGDLSGHTDVEDFGRDLSDSELADEAFRLLEQKLEQHGLVKPSVTPNKSFGRTRGR
jgi:hypothetical protein